MFSSIIEICNRTVQQDRSGHTQANEILIYDMKSNSVSAQLVFVDTRSKFVQLYIFPAFRFSIEDYRNPGREISIWERYNELRQEISNDDETTGLDSLLKALQKYLKYSTKSMLDATNTDKIAMSMIYHSDLVSDIGAAVPRESFGFFEHLIQNREDNSKLL